VKDDLFGVGLRGAGVRVRDGADSNLIEGGKVVVRKIHCTFERY
jgi:hypothetical protein